MSYRDKLSALQTTVASRLKKKDQYDLKSKMNLVHEANKGRQQPQPAPDPRKKPCFLKCLCRQRRARPKRKLGLGFIYLLLVLLAILVVSSCAVGQIAKTPQKVAAATASIGAKAASNVVVRLTENIGNTTDASENYSASCEEHFYEGKSPATNASMSRNTRLLCYSSFASLASGITRTPIWSAEVLTADRVRVARNVERVSNFFAEERLPANDRAELDDYRASGWDRGHLAPSADMPDLQAQSESFSLANIIPQSGALNRGPWADLESDVRNLANRRDVVYVVTGTLYEGSTVLRLPSGRVVIPTSIWKAVAAPGEGATVFIATNDQRAAWGKMTIDKFTDATGIDPFPALEDDDRIRLLQVGSR